MKDVPAPQWYESFASIGLEYGPTFQGLSSIKGAERQRLAEAKVGLIPTAKVMTGESRYILHPVVLDAAMQFCIVTAHSDKNSNDSHRCREFQLDEDSKRQGVLTTWLEYLLQVLVARPLRHVSKKAPDGARCRVGEAAGFWFVASGRDGLTYSH